MSGRNNLAVVSSLSSPSLALAVSSSMGVTDPEGAVQPSVPESRASRRSPAHVIKTTPDFVGGAADRAAAACSVENTPADPLLSARSVSPTRSSSPVTSRQPLSPITSSMNNGPSFSPPTPEPIMASPLTFSSRASRTISRRGSENAVELAPMSSLSLARSATTSPATLSRPAPPTQLLPSSRPPHSLSSSSFSSDRNRSSAEKVALPFPVQLPAAAQAQQFKSQIRQGPRQNMVSPLHSARDGGPVRARSYNPDEARVPPSPQSSNPAASTRLVPRKLSGASPSSSKLSARSVRTSPGGGASASAYPPGPPIIIPNTPGRPLRLRASPMQLQSHLSQPSPSVRTRHVLPPLPSFCSPAGSVGHLAYSVPSGASSPAMSSLSMQTPATPNRRLGGLSGAAMPERTPASAGRPLPLTPQQPSSVRLLPSHIAAAPANRTQTDPPHYRHMADSVEWQQPFQLEAVEEHAEELKDAYGHSHGHSHSHSHHHRARKRMIPSSFSSSPVPYGISSPVMSGSPPPSSPPAVPTPQRRRSTQPRADDDPDAEDGYSGGSDDDADKWARPLNAPRRKHPPAIAVPSDQRGAGAGSPPSGVPVSSPSSAEGFLTDLQQRRGRNLSIELPSLSTRTASSAPSADLPPPAPVQSKASAPPPAAHTRSQSTRGHGHSHGHSHGSKSKHNSRSGHGHGHGHGHAHGHAQPHGRGGPSAPAKASKPMYRKGREPWRRILETVYINWDRADACTSELLQLTLADLRDSEPTAALGIRRAIKHADIDVDLTDTDDELAEQLPPGQTLPFLHDYSYRADDEVDYIDDTPVRSDGALHVPDWLLEPVQPVMAAREAVYSAPRPPLPQGVTPSTRLDFEAEHNRTAPAMTEKLVRDMLFEPPAPELLPHRHHAHSFQVWPPYGYLGHHSAYPAHPMPAQGYSTTPLDPSTAPHPSAALSQPHFSAYPPYFNQSMPLPPFDSSSESGSTLPSASTHSSSEQLHYHGHAPHHAYHPSDDLYSHGEPFSMESLLGPGVADLSASLPPPISSHGGMDLPPSAPRSGVPTGRPHSSSASGRKLDR